MKYMNLGIVLFSIFVIFIIAIKTRIQSRENIENLDKENGINVENNIEEIFFEKIKGGENKYYFLKIDNQFDLMFIKSLFQSTQIPYYVEFEHISKIRPGMVVGDLGNYTLLYIVEKDYDDALLVTHEYIRNKTKNYDYRNKTKKIGRNLFEIFFTNWRIPSASDIGGIIILYKDNENKKMFFEEIEKIEKSRMNKIENEHKINREKNEDWWMKEENNE
jgi:hypothetical protein